MEITILPFSLFVPTTHFYSRKDSCRYATPRLRYPSFIFYSLSLSLSTKFGISPCLFLSLIPFRSIILSSLQIYLLFFSLLLHYFYGSTSIRFLIEREKMLLQNMDIDYAQKIQKCHEYVEALEEEQKKIQVFQRELPLCLELVTQAIEACRKELSGTSTTSEQVHGGQSECSEQTTSVCGGHVFEEFIPIKKNDDEEHESSPQPPENNNNNIDNKKKSDWLRSVQLWNPSPDPNPTEVSNPDRVVVVAKKAKVVEVKPNCGAFQPFLKEKKRVLEPPVVKSASSVPAPAPATTTSSTTETGGVEKLVEEKFELSQTRRKQRRCWSPELHRRFLHALQQLGGSHVATPKQIRDHMKVDGLTNDEVKSHLQKYRLHTRRPATSVAAQSNGNPQQPQFVVVGGIWVPSSQDYPPPPDVANNGGGGIYAPVAAQQPPPSPQSPKHSVERSSGRCNSPAVSSSTNTTTTSSPVS